MRSVWRLTSYWAVSSSSVGIACPSVYTPFSISVFIACATVSYLVIYYRLYKNYKSKFTKSTNLSTYIIQLYSLFVKMFLIDAYLFALKKPFLYHMHKYFSERMYILCIAFICALC